MNIRCKDVNTQEKSFSVIESGITYKMNLSYEDVKILSDSQIDFEFDGIAVIIANCFFVNSEEFIVEVSIGYEDCDIYLKQMDFELNCCYEQLFDLVIDKIFELYEFFDWNELVKERIYRKGINSKNFNN